jgi:catecholate siderophore receptor
MVTQAKNNVSGSSIDKKGVAASLCWGIDERSGFQASLYPLDNGNSMNHDLPWIRPNPRLSASNPAGSPPNTTTVMPLDPKAYVVMASAHNPGSATALTRGHTHRFDRDHGMTAQLRVGRHTRNQRASTIRFAPASLTWWRRSQPDHLRPGHRVQPGHDI